MRTLSESQKNYILQYFFEIYNYDTLWVKVITELFEKGTVGVTYFEEFSNRIGRTAEFIKTSSPEDFIGTKFYTFDLESFLISQYFQEKTAQFVSNVLSLPNQREKYTFLKEIGELLLTEFDTLEVEIITSSESLNKLKDNQTFSMKSEKSLFEYAKKENAEVKKYMSHPKYVTAIQWTGSNFDAIQKAFGSKFYIEDEMLYMRSKHNSPRLIQIYDFIIEDVDGEVIAYSPMEFRDLYQEFKEPFQLIGVIPNSFIFTPVQIRALKKKGINLKKIYNEIHRELSEINPDYDLEDLNIQSNHQFIKNK